MKVSRHLLIVIVLVLMVASVAGIFLFSDRTRPDESVRTRQSEIPITLSWWGNDGRHKYTMEGVDLFQKKNPEIRVNYRYGVWNGYEKRNKVWMESHDEADVMQINFAWVKEYSPKGTGFYDLRKLSKYIDLSNFTEEELRYGESNGVLNAIPIAMNTQTFYYNQELLDHFGSKVPESWDDLLALGKKAKTEGKYALGVAKKQMFLLMIAHYEQTTGKPVFNEDGTLAVDEAGILSMLTFYRKMIDEHALCPVDSFDRTRYMSGEVIGAMCWISDTKIYCDGMAETGVTVTRAPYPKAAGAAVSGWYVKPATMWAISANTAHPEEAAKLLDHLLNDREMAILQGTEKGVPVSHAAVEALSGEGLTDTNEYKATREMKEHMDEFHQMIPNMENETIIDVFKSGADEYLYDKQSAGDCAKSIYGEMKKLAAGEQK